MKSPLFAAALILGLAACTPKTVEKLPYYKLSVVQGIPLEPQAVLAVLPGMSRHQVEMEIGTPLLKPMFRPNRWDYVYEVSKGGKVKENRTLTVWFTADGVVERVEGDALDYARSQIRQGQQQ